MQHARSLAVRRILLLFSLVFLAVSLAVPPLGADDPAESLIVLVNQKDRDSIELGRFYAEKRDVPPENIIAIPAPTDETITWTEFIEEIFNPLQTKLMEDGWIEGVTSSETDQEGRYRHRLLGHNLSYLVVCRGIPVRIEHDEDRLTDEIVERVQEEFRHNSAAVDSELSLLAVGIHPITAFIQNPLFQQWPPEPRAERAIIKVSRLDGPTARDARRLVESAIEGERAGLRGRAYVDLKGPHAGPAQEAAQRGEGWLGDIARQLQEATWDVTVREERGTFSANDRFDAPALYFGWYSRHVDGPFRRDGFEFPPGAVAIHIHSFSAETVRDPTRFWAGPFAARGVAATVGNVYEPYLQATHHPHFFLRRLLAGENVGDAAYYALPVLSWHSLVLGDPLYRPFGVTLEEQLERASEDEDDPLNEYVHLREMRRLADAGDLEAAIDAGRAGFLKSPGLALGLEVARLRLEAGKEDEMLDTLRFVDILDTIGVRHAQIGGEVAAFLAEHGETERAVRLYDLVLSAPGLPEEIRESLLAPAASAAESAGDRTRARQWRAELD